MDVFLSEIRLFQFSTQPNRWKVQGRRAWGIEHSTSLRSGRILATMIPPVNSLVRYDNPILVATSKGKKGEGPKAPAAVSQTEDILNSILPPRYARYHAPAVQNTLPPVTSAD